MGHVHPESPAQEPNALLIAALAYRSRGYFVFPCWWKEEGHCACPKGMSCKSPCKHPLTSRGFKDASNDTAHLGDWWRRWCHANVAIATGSVSGIVVIDVDPRHGGDEALARLEAELGPLPSTLVALTQSKGRHFYFKAPGTRIPCTAGVLGSGIDVRGDGGYIVAPPSVGVAGTYCWDTTTGEPDDAVAELPAAWRHRALSAARDAVSLPVDGPIAEGHRNTTLTSLAGTLRHRGMNHGVIQASLEVVNRKQCQPPLADDEVARIARSVASYPAGATAGTEGPPEFDLQTGAAFGAIHLKVNKWVTKAIAEVHGRRDGELLLAERVSPGSSRSRRSLVAAVQKIEPAADVDAVQRALMALSARQSVATPSADVALQGRAVVFDPIDPWPESVDGSALLDDLVATLHKHMALKRAAAVVLALWIVAAHAYQHFDIFPRVVVRSPTKRCGKTRLLDLMATMLARCLPCANVSLASLFRSVQEYHPVLLLDEVDRYLQTNPELIGLLNAGHKRDAIVLRCVGENSEPRAFDVFCPVVMAGIGNAPDTLMDRAHVIDLQRRTKGETVAPLRARDLADVRSRIVPRIVRWVADQDAELLEADPDAPGSLDDRAADNAVPLLAVADIVGGEWPPRARSAIATLSGCRQEADDGMGLLLLGDLRAMFDEREVDALPTKTILRSLCEREDRPWRECGSRDRPITGWHLGRMLAGFGIASTYVQDAGDRRKLRGYRRTDLQDAWARYGFDDPLRDFVPSGVSGEESGANGDSGLRSKPSSERSADSPTDAISELEWPDSTESRSGDGALNGGHLPQASLGLAAPPVGHADNWRALLRPLRRSGLDAGNVCSVSGGSGPL